MRRWSGRFPPQGARLQIADGEFALSPDGDYVATIGDWQVQLTTQDRKLTLEIPPGDEIAVRVRRVDE